MLEGHNGNQWVISGTGVTQMGLEIDLTFYLKKQGKYKKIIYFVFTIVHTFLNLEMVGTTVRGVHCLEEQTRPRRLS